MAKSMQEWLDEYKRKQGQAQSQGWQRFDQQPQQPRVYGPQERPVYGPQPRPEDWQPPAQQPRVYGPQPRPSAQPGAQPSRVYGPQPQPQRGYDPRYDDPTYGQGGGQRDSNGATIPPGPAEAEQFRAQGLESIYAPEIRLAQMKPGDTYPFWLQKQMERAAGAAAPDMNQPQNLPGMNGWRPPETYQEFDAARQADQQRMQEQWNTEPWARQPGTTAPLAEWFADTPAGAYFIQARDERMQDAQEKWAKGDPWAMPIAAASNVGTAVFEVPTKLITEIPVPRGPNADPATEGATVGDLLAFGGTLVNRTLNPFNPNRVQVPAERTESGIYLPGQGGGMPRIQWDKVPGAIQGMFTQAGDEAWADLLTSTKVRQTIEAMPEDKQAIYKPVLWNSISGGQHVQDTYKAFQQKENVGAMRTRADELMRTGRMDEASKLYQQAAALDAQSYTDIVNNNQNVWAELVAGVFLDPLNLLDKPMDMAIEGWRASRAASKFLAPAASTLDDLEAAAKTGQKLLGWIEAGRPAVADAAAVVGEEAGKLREAAGRYQVGNWLTDLFRRTPETQAHIDSNWLYRTAAQLLHGVDNAADARTILQTWIDDPAQLVRGVQNAAGDMNRYGMGLVGNAEVLQRQPILQVARNRILNLEALNTTAGFNPVEVMAQFDSAVYGAARKLYGLQSIADELPMGTTAVQARALGDQAGQWVVEFLGKVPGLGDQAGKETQGVLASTGKMTAAEASRYRQAVMSALQGNQANPLQKSLNLMTGVQRGVMSDMWLNLRPAHWIRNAAAATAATMTDDLYSLRPINGILTDLSTKFAAGMPTERLAEGVGQVMGAAAAEPHWTRKAWDKGNVYASANEAANRVWSGMTHLLGTNIPFGEQAFYVRAFDRGFSRTFGQAWEGLVGDTVGRWAKNFGVDPAEAKAIADALISTGKLGSKGDVVQAGRKAAYSATQAFDLRGLGIGDEVLSTDGWRNLSQILQTYFEQQAGVPPVATQAGELVQNGLQGTQDILSKVHQIFGEERVRPANILREAPPQPGVYEWHKLQVAQDTADVADNLVEAATKAGVPPAQAQKEAMDLAQRLLQGEEVAWEEFLRELGSGATSSAAMNVSYDLLARVYDLKRLARMEVDQASKLAVATNSAEGWLRKWDQTKGIYTKLAGDIQEVFGQAVGDMRAVVAGQEVPKRYDWWDVIKRYIDYDEVATMQARQIGLGSSYNTPMELFDKVIGANRAYVDASYMQLHEALRRWPDMTALDVMRATQKQLDLEGARAAAYLEPLRNSALQGKLKWDDFFELRNRTWNAVADNQVVFNQAATRAIIANGLGKETQSALRWTDDFAGGEFLLLGPAKDKTATAEMYAAVQDLYGAKLANGVVPPSYRAPLVRKPAKGTPAGTVFGNRATPTDTADTLARLQAAGVLQKTGQGYTLAGLSPQDAMDAVRKAESNLWQARNMETGKLEMFAGPGIQTTMVQVPQQVVNDYYRVTEQFEKIVDQAAADVAKAAPLPSRPGVAAAAQAMTPEEVVGRYVRSQGAMTPAEMQRARQAEDLRRVGLRQQEAMRNQRSLRDALGNVPPAEAGDGAGIPFGYGKGNYAPADASADVAFDMVGTDRPMPSAGPAPSTTAAAAPGSERLAPTSGWRVSERPIQSGDTVRVKRTGERLTVNKESEKGGYLWLINQKGEARRFKRGSVELIEPERAATVEEGMAQAAGVAPKVDAVSMETPAEIPAVTLPPAKRGAVGSTTRAWSDPARPYDLQYEAVELGDLVASNASTGGVNPAYPVELQPRDRSQAASMQQVQDIAKRLSEDELLADTNAIDRGSPIVDARNVVLSGNGRTMALRLASTDDYGAYRRALVARAGTYGIDPAQVEQMTLPVLVRRAGGDIDPVAFAQEANGRTTLAMNAAEQARVLAGKITTGDLADFVATEADNLKQALTAASSRDFVRRILGKVPTNERAGLVDAAGQLTAQGVDTIRSALFGLVFPDAPTMLRNFVLSPTPDLANIGNGIERAIVKMAQAQLTSPDLAIGDELAQAANLLLQARRSGQSIEGALAQGGLFGELPAEVRRLAEFLDENIRSGRKIGQLLNAYSDRALQHVAGQATMFADVVPSKVDLLGTATRAAEDLTATLFDFDVPLAKGLRDADQVQEEAKGLYQIMRRYWMREKQPEMGDVALHMVTTINDAERRVAEFIMAGGQRKANGLNEVARRALVDLVDRELAPKFDDAVAMASYAAERAANGAMLNYKDRRGFDQILGLVFPYHYFWTRGGWTWAQRVLRKPSAANFFYEVQRAVDSNSVQDQVANRLQGTMFVTRTPDGQLRLGNPLNFILPWNQYLPSRFDRAPIESETAHEWATETEKWLARIGAVAPGTYPVWEVAGAAAMDALWPLPDGQKRVPSFEVRNYIPIAGLAADARMGLTGQTTGPLLGGSGFDPYRVRRSAAVLAQQGKLDPQVAQYAQQISMNVEAGRDRYYQVPPAQQQAAEAALRQAGMLAGQERMASSWGGFLGGVPGYTFSDAEGQILQAGSDYAGAGYDPNLNPAGSAAARRGIIDQNPALPVYWSRSAAPGGAQPGERADAALMYDALDRQVYGPMAAAVTAAILANPNITQKELTQIKAPFWARNEEIRKQFPNAAAASGNLPSGANPQEQALWQLEQMLQVPGKPAWPGDKATPAQMQAYYTATAAWEEQRLNAIDSRLNNFMQRAVMEPTEPWMAALVKLVQGGYSSDIVRRVEDLKHAGPVEKAWAEREALRQETGAANWQSKVAGVGERMGPQGAAIFEAYSQADDATRKQMKEQDPRVREALMAGYSPHEYDQAIVQFGPDAWENYYNPQRPQYPADGADDATMQAYYAQLDKWNAAHPRDAEMRLWLNGRSSWSGKASSTAPGSYDFGKDWQRAKAIFGPNIFTIEREANLAPNYGQWARANPQAATLLTGYREWKKAELQLPTSMAWLAEQNPLDLRTAGSGRPLNYTAVPQGYTGPRPVGSDRRPIGAPDWQAGASDVAQRAAAAAPGVPGVPGGAGLPAAGPAGLPTAATGGLFDPASVSMETAAGGPPTTAEGWAMRNPKQAAYAAKSAEWAARKAAVYDVFGPEVGGFYETYLGLPKGAQRDQYRAEHPELRAVNLYAFQPDAYRAVVDQFGQDGLMAWAMTPAYGTSDEAKARRTAYYDANPAAFVVGAWLYGRPSAERDGQDDADPGAMYDLGSDYASAREMFGANIWDVVAGYKRGWGKAEKRAYFDANPQLSPFFDWWYGNLAGQGATTTGRYYSSGRTYGHWGGGGGGSSSSGRRYNDAPRVYAQEMLRDLQVAPAAYPRGWQPPRFDYTFMKAGDALRPNFVEAWRPPARWTPRTKR